MLDRLHATLGSVFADRQRQQMAVITFEQLIVQRLNGRVAAGPLDEVIEMATQGIVSACRPLVALDLGFLAGQQFIGMGSNASSPRSIIH